LALSAVRDTLLRTRTATLDSLFEALAIFRARWLGAIVEPQLCGHLGAVQRVSRYTPQRRRIA
jgi:hypothetical protein